MFEWVNNKKFGKEEFNTSELNNDDVAVKFDIARKITNGTKNFKNRAKTRVQTGYTSGFGDGFAKPLNIELPNNKKISADIFIRELITFWKEQKDNGAF